MCFEYCCANKIIINYDKCCFIEFNRKSTDVEYNLSILHYKCDNFQYSHKFERVTKCKFLGVIINQNLDWKDHIKHVKKQGSQAIGALYSAKSAVPQKILRSLYFALVQPYFVYTLPLWGSNHSMPEINELFILQKKAIRIITNKTTKIAGTFQNTKILFKKTNILTVHNLYFYLTTTEVRKILTESKPEQIHGMFMKSARSNRLILPKFNKERYKSKSFIFNASKIANYFISNNIDLYAMSQSTLKINLKRYLIARQSTTLHKDPNWFPYNLSIFTDIAL